MSTASTKKSRQANHSSVSVVPESKAEKSSIMFVRRMNCIPRSILAAGVAAILVLPVVVHAGPRSHLLDEDAALALLDHTLKHDGVYTHRISLDCVTYGTEETTKAYFQFVLRENHNAKCGGDPEISPVVDRYRVYRRSRKIERLDPVEDTWRPYNPSQVK
jgi:hypothetical protein